jgi:hypothetical protein
VIVLRQQRQLRQHRQQTACRRYPTGGPRRSLLTRLTMLTVESRFRQSDGAMQVVLAPASSAKRAVTWALFSSWSKRFTSDGAANAADGTDLIEGQSLGRALRLTDRALIIRLPDG